MPPCWRFIPFRHRALTNHAHPAGRSEMNQEVSDGSARSLPTSDEALECRPIDRPKGAAEAEAHLGDPTTTQSQPRGARSGDVQLCPRREVAWLRSLEVRIRDVAIGSTVRQRSTVVQQKTGRPVPFEITEPARDALSAWLLKCGGRADDWLFPSRSAPGRHIGTRQYARLVDKWVRMIDLEPAAY